MEMSRAQQIISSSGNINVFYLGSYVWIENLNRADASAEITNLETQEKDIVPVSMLFEV